MIIGDWVKRHRTRAVWHLVESTINGAAITRCGRRMEPESLDLGRVIGLDVSHLQPYGERACVHCV